MVTYLILNLIFLVVVCTVLKIGKRHLSKPFFITLAVLLLLTLIFDNVIILLGIVGYDADKILGIYLYKAPIEDFMYAVLAVLLVPALWNKIGKTNA